MKAAIYARYSTDQQSEASIEDQTRECERLAVTNNLVVVASYDDKGISAGTADRPGYQALLQSARAHTFDVILVEDISRLWRSGAEYGPRAAELEDLGVHLLTCVGDDTRREGWGLMLAIKQAMAEHARREISYRTRRGMEGLALAGKPTGGRVYGYRGGAIDPAEAARVRGIFEMAAAGVSQAAIAAQLNYEGVPAVRGGPWRQSTISGILRNERYLGAVQWGRSVYKCSAANSRLRRRLMRSEGPLVCRDDAALQIVDTALFGAVNPAKAA
jgi:DNA invertase Pin-like site-specific DNA recombinase